MVDTPQNTCQLLTKRPRRLARMASALPGPSNVWMGVSVESQEEGWRIDDLRYVPAAIRFISAEPLSAPLTLDLAGVDWVIVGGESGHNHPLIDPEWVRNLRDQCTRAGVAFFLSNGGGMRARAGGRLLDGRTWDEMPASRVLTSAQGAAGIPLAGWP
jgi:protein gp37